MGLGKRLWNAFFSRDPTDEYKKLDASTGSIVSSSKPDRTRRFISNERSIIMSIYNRIALDVASIKISLLSIDARTASRSSKSPIVTLQFVRSVNF